jgi:hypothetical protein
MIAIAGQLAMALFLDRIGAFGIDRIEISPQRIAGVLLVLRGRSWSGAERGAAVPTDRKLGVGPAGDQRLLQSGP